MAAYSVNDCIPRLGAFVLCVRTDVDTRPICLLHMKSYLLQNCEEISFIHGASAKGNYVLS